MSSKACSIALISILFICSLSKAEFINYQQQLYSLLVSSDTCQRALYSEQYERDGRSDLLELGLAIINGTGPRSFFQKAARSEASILNALIHNHLFYSSLTDYQTYFQYRYGISLKEALRIRNILQCKPCKGATLYPNFQPNQKVIDKYRTVDDELDARPKVRSNGPDGYRMYYPNFNEDGVHNQTQENIFCLNQLFHAPEQAFCLHQNLNKAEEKMKPFFENKPGVDENVDRSRSLILNWLPNLNLPQLYGYVSFMTYAAYGKNILDVYQSCAEGLYDTTIPDSEDINTNP